MSFETLSVISLALAGIPALLFFINLLIYPTLPTKELQGSFPSVKPTGPVSVLIPARNEDSNIEAALTSVLASEGVEFEVIVLDDHSTDRTAQIVAQLAARDSRVRLAAAPPLPDGWCGKPHACHVLAGLARHALLVFLDADVRLAPDALARMTTFMERPDLPPPANWDHEPAAPNRNPKGLRRSAGLPRRSPEGEGGFTGRIPPALASGVPRQELGSFAERLLLPLIHFVLLSYLPMHVMRRTRRPAFSAGCGQLFVAWQAAYLASGGHAAIRSTLHDGVKLPRAFRRAGFATDLFDATDLATCRMYRSAQETWRGLGKNAAEGLAASGTIVPMTLLLLGGQVLPFVLLVRPVFWPLAEPSSLGLPALAAACALIPRLVALRRFHQPWLSAMLHPLGVLALVAIQWAAWIRQRIGWPCEWKGRAYSAPASPPSKQGLRATLLGLAVGFNVASLGAFGQAPVTPRPTGAAKTSCPEFALRDQFDQQHQYRFPRTNLLILKVAGKEGSAQVDQWVGPLKKHLGDRVAIAGIADLRGVPEFWRGSIRKKFQKLHSHPVMLDWDGAIVAKLPFHKNQANLYLLARDGTVLRHTSGNARKDTVQHFLSSIEWALENP